MTYEIGNILHECPPKSRNNHCYYVIVSIDAATKDVVVYSLQLNKVLSFPIGYEELANSPDNRWSIL